MRYFSEKKAIIPPPLTDWETHIQVKLTEKINYPSRSEEVEIS